MAEAQLRQETVVKKFVRLDLTEEEAEFLKDVLCRIGGDPDSTRRKHQVAINSALGHVGVCNTALGDATGYVTFEARR